MKQGMKKKLTVFLALLLCIGLLPTGVLAAGEQVARYQTAEGGAVLTGSFQDAVANVYDGGVIELLGNVELTETVTITKSVTIQSDNENDMRQISISTPNHGYLLNLQGAVTLKNLILDGGGVEATRALVAVNSGNNTVTLDCTRIQRNNNRTVNGAGGGLCVISGTVVMNNNSTIFQCEAQSGGGAALVSSGSKLVLNSGSIGQNKAWGSSYLYGGGGVYIAQGTFEMNGGSITQNEGYTGGGIHTNHNTNASITMTGGTITHNLAKYGGGIYSSQIALMELYGGSITANSAETRGGGVQLAPYSLVKLKGDIQIDGNTSSGGNAYHNLYVEANPKTSWDRPILQVVGPLTNTLGLSTILPAEAEQDQKLHLISSDGSYVITDADFAAFRSDDAKYHILQDQTQNTLFLQPHTYVGWDSDADGHWETCECGLQTAPLAHVWDNGEDITLATCGQKGVTRYTCTVCAYQKDVETDLEPLSHPYDKFQHHEPVDATCTQDGSTEYWHCTECGKYFDSALTAEITQEQTVVKASGHQPELRNAKAATCIAEGYTGDKICKVCDEPIEPGTAIPKGAHNMVNGACTVCGYREPAVNPDTPKTDDNSNVMLWLALLLLSAGGFLGATVYRKKNGFSE